MPETTPTKSNSKKTSLWLLQIPYNWEKDKSQHLILPMGSKEQAREYVDKYKEEKNEKHYFLLIEGALIPTANWVPEDVTYHVY